MFTRSTDGGVTFSRPVKVNMPGIRNQGTAIAVNPLDGRVYIFFRMFSPDNVGYVVSSDFGQTFSRVATVFPEGSFRPFDQPTIDSPFEAFRTNAYPTAVVDGLGRVHVAVADRDASGSPRIVVTSSSNNGGTWSPRSVADARPNKGPQVMPALTFAAGRLLLSWYEARLTHPQDTGLVTFPGYPAYTIGITRIFDVRTLTANAGAPGQTTFGASVPVSQYNFYAATGAAIGENFGNLPMFRGGLAPFLGDYIAAAPMRQFVRARPGSNWPHPWKPVLTPADDPAAAVVNLWADNRDVIAPTMPASAPSFTFYDPPGTGQLSCRNPGSRNANIYGAETAAVVAGSLQSFKQLGDGAPNDTMQRAFAVYVQNRSDEDRFFRVSLLPDAGVLASFQQIGAADAIDVKILRHSSITATVYVRSQNPTGSVRVDVSEISAMGVNPPPGTQPSASFTINADPTNPFVSNPFVSNPFVSNPGVNAAITETHTPFVTNPFVTNPFVSNPGLVDANNKLLANPFVSNPFVTNPFVSNPFVTNQAVYDIQDITWQTQNAGSTASAFTALVNIPDGDQLSANGDYQFQLLIYRRQLTGGVQNCDTTTTITDQIISNVPNPFVTNPFVSNPFVTNPFVTNPFVTNPFVTNPFVTNSTFSSAPSESAPQSARANVRRTPGGPTLVRQVSSPIGSDGTTLDEPTSDTVFVTLRVYQMKPDHEVAVQFDATQTPPSLGVFSQAADVINGVIQETAASAYAAPNFVPSLTPPSATPAVGAGASFTYPNVSIVNNGNTPSNSITGSFRSGYYLSSDATFGPGDVLLGTATTPNSVLPAPGTTSLPGPTLTIPSSTAPGFWHVLMVVDDLGNVAESSETDNVAGLLIQVLPASVAFSTQPGLGVANDALGAFTVTVRDTSGAALPAVNVTISIGTNAGGGVLSGTMTKQTDPTGVATFDDLVLSRGGDGYTLVATAALSGSPSATSSPFYVVGFGDAPNTIAGRSGHAATLLADGRVLVTGGSGSATAEIYDPSTNSWSSTGSLVANRSRHTATLLGDGRVLVTGGLATPTGSVLSSAEIYNPATGTFSALLDTLASPRTDHRAVLLTTGKVLIAGGSIGAPGNPVSLASADLFDPATSEFTATTAMDIARELHTMTRLADGSVLVAGGRTCFPIDGGGSGCTFRDTAVRYDPAGSVVTAVGAMATRGQPTRRRCWGTDWCWCPEASAPVRCRPRSSSHRVRRRSPRRAP